VNDTFPKPTRIYYGAAFLFGQPHNIRNEINYCLGNRSFLISRANPADL
jgi:hypothetical protein